MTDMLSKFNKISYVIMAVLVGALLIFAVVASATGNGPMMRSPLTFVIFAAYALLQIVCIALYDFGLNIRKTGFYFLHIGMLVMLVGFLAYIISGEYYNLNFSVGEYYNGFYTSEGRYVDFGFGISVNDFTVEKYGSGTDKYYRADLLFSDSSAEKLEVNKTVRKNGWKLFLMDYSDGKKEFVSTFGHYSFDYDFYGGDWEELLGKIQTMEYPVESIMIYEKSAGGYVSESAAKKPDSPSYAHILVKDGKAYVYVNRLTVNIAFKKDPGEYAVIAGMCMIFVGVVMTGLLKPIKRRENDGKGAKKV